MDNRSAVDAGGLRRGTISIHVQKPQFSEAFPGADELTLRAEEMGMQRTHINTKHTEFERWGPPIVDVLARLLSSHLEWDKLYYHYKELNQAARVKKPSESQIAKVGNESDEGQG